MTFRIQKISYFLNKLILVFTYRHYFFFLGAFSNPRRYLLGIWYFSEKEEDKQIGFPFLIIINHFKASIQNLFKKRITIILSVETKVLVCIVLNLTADDYNSSIVPNTFWYHSKHISSKQYTAFLQSAFFPCKHPLNWVI